MPNRPVTRFMLIGLDGAMPNMLEKFRDEGSIPNIAKLMKEGAFMEALPCPPVDTPTNWVTIVTGAWPGTHGITSFTVHLPGEPLDVGHSTVDLDATTLCEAEFFWDAAERAGKKCLVLNYLCSWPSTMKKGLLVGGPSPRGHDSWILGPSVHFVSGVSETATRSFRSEISLKRAKNWKGLPRSSAFCLEARIPGNFIEPAATTDLWQTWERVLKQRRDKAKPRASWKPTYYLLIVNQKRKDSRKVYISRTKDFASVEAILRPGEWSGWMYEEVATRDGQARGGFRFRLNELSADGSRFELYRTPIYSTSGWTDPPDLAEGITEAIGPYASGHESYPMSAHSRKYNEIYFEQVSQFANYLADTAKYLKDRWEILITQIHVQDEFCHEVGFEGIDVTSPNYQPTRSQSDWQIMRRQYQVCDQWIGRLIKECADKNTLIAVISDHAAIPIRKTIPINQILANAGLLATKEDATTGSLTIDWEKTKAYNRPGFPIGYIWVNVKGRDPEGIVELGKEYEAVCDQVITTLYSLKDPENGRCPIALALKKSDAALLGQWGDRAPDVFYAFQAGYMRGESTVIPRGVKLGRQEQEMLLSHTAGRGTHGGFLPTAQLGPCTNKALFILTGPGVKRGYRKDHPIWLTDVAPTVSHLLAIPTPAQSEGAVIGDILA